MSRNVEEIASLIKQVKELKLENCDLKEIKVLIDNIFEGHKTLGWAFKPTYPLYRAIAYNEHPDFVHQMSYNPNIEKITEFGRCNFPHEATFYCCTTSTGTLKELKKDWRTAYIGVWGVQKELNLNNIGFTDKVCTLLGSQGDFARRVQASKEREWYNGSNEMIYEFMSEVFTQQIASKETFRYKLSASIYHSMIRGQPPGLLFPSVANNGRYDNLALKAEIIDNGWLKLIQVNRIDKIFISESSNFVEALTATAIPLNDGKLKWFKKKKVGFSQLMDGEGYLKNN